MPWPPRPTFLDKPQRMKEATGYPVAVRGGDEVLIICGIVAVDPATDAAILRVEAHNLQRSLCQPMRRWETASFASVNLEATARSFSAPRDDTARAGYGNRAKSKFCYQFKGHQSHNFFPISCLPRVDPNRHLNPIQISIG
jgi:hypothetical protein